LAVRGHEPLTGFCIRRLIAPNPFMGAQNMFQQWFRRRKPLQSRPSTRRRGRWISLGLEWLEARTLLSFFTPTTLAVGSSPVAQATGDFNGDGRVDLAVVNQGANTVSVLLGNGNGTFQAKTDFATGTSPPGRCRGRHQRRRQG